MSDASPKKSHMFTLQCACKLVSSTSIGALYRAPVIDQRHIPDVNPVMTEWLRKRTMKPRRSNPTPVYMHATTKAS